MIAVCIIVLLCLSTAYHKFLTEDVEYEVVTTPLLNGQNAASWEEECKERGYDGLAVIQSDEELNAFRYSSNMFSACVCV